MNIRKMVYYAVPAFLLATGLIVFILVRNPPHLPVIYQSSDSDFPNPERGLYSQYTYGPDSPNQLTATSLHADRKRNITLLLRLYYLSEFLPPNLAKDPPVHIPQSFKLFLKNDFDAIRTAGQKAIMRFAYQSQEGDYPCDVEHHQDPGLAQVLMHIDDIGPILADNSDVIAVVQSGFIGTWGEWFYANPDFVHVTLDCPPPASCAPSCGILSLDYKFSARRQVTDALLHWLPPSRSIQLRTPHYKNAMYGSGERPVRSDAIDTNTAFDGTTKSRIGHHNDCFLGLYHDEGTYSSYAAAEMGEKEYLEQETRFLPMGGETCEHNAPTSCCSEAELNLKRFHWSYLHNGYNNCVLATWGKTWTDATERSAALTGCGQSAWPPPDCSGNCYDSIKKHLGYRFRLISGSYPFSASVGHEMDFAITLRNEGYAAPFNPRTVELIFRNRRNTSIKYAVKLNVDPRRWAPGGDINIRHSICLPEDMIQDDYDLLLNLPDPEPALNHDSRYSIRFANSGSRLSPARELLWEDSSGYNDLQWSIHVDSSDGNVCSSNSPRLVRTN